MRVGYIRKQKTNMSVPHVASTTIGLSLPSFTIHKELEQGAHKKPIRSAVVTKVPVAKAGVARKNNYFTFVPALLLALNIGMFLFYLISVNQQQAYTYKATQAQKELEVLRDQQRQWQVKIADASSGIRMREVAVGTGEFVSVGTPEFITAHNTSTLTMR